MSLCTGGLDVTASSATADALATEMLNVVVLHLAGTGDTAELRTLAQACPQARIVCVAVRPAWKTVRGLLRDGAAAVVAEEDVDSALALAVESAHVGQLSLPGRLRREIAQPVLSIREKQMLAMVVMGFSNPEIAGKFHVTESTVKSHLSSAFNKLGVRSRNEATALILDPEHGLGTGILEISGEAPEARLAPAPAA